MKHRGLGGPIYFIAVLEGQVQGVSGVHLFRGLSSWLEDGRLLAVSSQGRSPLGIVCILIFFS